jgi:hypothetical protein
LFVAHHVPEGSYVVIRRLPKREGEFEYQLKSIDEPNKRVVRESQLRPNLPTYTCKKWGATNTRTIKIEK